MNTENNIQSIIKKICSIECSLENLSSMVISKEKEDEIVQILCMTSSPNDIYLFAKSRPNLSEENKDKLTQAICKTGKMDILFDFLSDVRGLTSKNSEMIVKTMLMESENLEKQIDSKGKVKQFK